jgi:hypothetical protein
MPDEEDGHRLPPMLAVDRQVDLVHTPRRSQLQKSRTVRQA